MKAILQREKHPLVTPGTIQFNYSHPKIYTMELPWKDNQRKISCIPAGIYKCVPHITINSKGVARDTWQLQNVPIRDGINFDIANFACDCVYHGKQKHAEILGCIAVGFDRDLTIPMLIESGNAMKYLLGALHDKSFELEIKNP